MFNWRLKATNAIYLEDANGQEGRPFKSRFLQSGLVKYDFGVCLLKKETIDKFVNTFVECPVIINHKDNIASDDVVGTIQKIWFSADDGWFWCSGVITDDTAVELIEKGYNVSCQYRITEYADNDEGKLHNANPYDKEILDGVFEHLAIVENPRYEDAFIAVNGGKYNLVNGIPTCPPGVKAYIATNGGDGSGNFDHASRPGEVGGSSSENAASKYKIYEEFEEDYKSLIEDSPEDYPFTDYNEIIKDLDIDNNKFKEIKSPIETIQVRARNIKHLTDNKDKTRIKSLNKMLATLEKPLLINELDGKKVYFKLFKNADSTKKHLTVVGTDDDGNFLTTTIPVKKDNWYFKQLKKGNTIYDSLSKRRKGNTNAPVSNSITDNQINFNPNVTINVATNDYKKVFDWIKNTEGESMDTETKNVFSQLLEALKARNEAEDEEKEKKKDKEDEKATNEDIDKRKLIDEVGGILKGKVDEEVWRTIIGKIEKVAYDKSEAGTADNSKAKNEDVDKRDLIRQIMAIAGKHEDNEDVRTIAKLAEKLAYDKSEAGTADNSKCKNAEEEKLYEELKERVEKEAENKKAKNALDDAVNLLYSAMAPEPKSTYVSQAEGLAMGKQIYG